MTYSKPKKRGRPRKNVFHEYLEAAVTKTSLDLVGEIDTLVKEVHRNLENPQRLGVILLELSGKNIGLGNYLIEAKDEERTLETQYKWTVDKRKIELTETPDPNSKKGENYSATTAESKAKVEAQLMLEALNIAKKNVDILQIKRGDVERFTSIGQTVLRDIGQNMVRP